MLIGKLFTLEDINQDEKILTLDVILNAKHPLFAGHFPDVPVLPGVTMMQMVKELLEVGEQESLQINKSGNMKFLQMVNPEKTDRLKIVINIIDKDSNTIRIKSQIFDKENICFKMTAHLSIVA